MQDVIGASPVRPVVVYLPPCRLDRASRRHLPAGRRDH
jgi:hypothetical protein